MRQGVRLEPLLEAISKFLDSEHEMIERVRRDLVRGLKKPRKGRRGLTAPQVLRSLVVMRVKNWDYRELRERIADGVTLRQFTDFYCDPVPKHDAFNRGFNRLTPQTLKAINDLVVQAAVGLGLEDGAKLRVDTTVVETDIHHPTDNTLLWDVVRVVTRLVGRLAKVLKMRHIKGFRDRRRSAHRRMYEIQRMTTRQRQEHQTTIYRALIGIAEEVVASAKTALEKTATMRGKDLFAAMAIDAIRDEIAHYCGLGERVIDQARRRVLEGEQVPNAEKIYSIFEPHTDLIKRGKVRTPVEFADSGDCGPGFRLIADSIPMIADSGSRRRLQWLTRRCWCQACHAWWIFPVVCAGSRRRGQGGARCGRGGRGRHRRLSDRRSPRASGRRGADWSQSSSCGRGDRRRFRAGRGPAARSAEPAPSRRGSEARHGRGS